MKVLILEDELPASHRLKRLLKELDKNYEVIDVLSSVEQAINWFLHNPAPDLILMDIQLEDGISFELFESCEINTPVIFTTAYDDYVLKAFKVNSVDYLLKPIALEELRRAVDKFDFFYHNKTVCYTPPLESVLQKLQPKTKERFLVRIGEHYRSIPTSRIKCFFIEERCNFMVDNNAKIYSVDYSLDKIEQLVDPLLFFRINRNVIIHYNSIKDVVVYSSSRLKVIMDTTEGGDTVVSRERVAEFKKWLDR